MTTASPTNREGEGTISRNYSGGVFPPNSKRYILVAQTEQGTFIKRKESNSLLLDKEDFVTKSKEESRLKNIVLIIYDKQINVNNWKSKTVE